MSLNNKFLKECAKEKSNINIIKKLLKKGADLHTIDEKGNNAIHYAIKSDKNNKTLKFLLKNNINVDVINNDGGTPLYLACSHNMSSLKTVRLLIKYGANITSYNWNGYTSIETLCVLNMLSVYNTDIIILLLKNGATILEPYIRHSLNKTKKQILPVLYNLGCLMTITPHDTKIIISSIILLRNITISLDILFDILENLLCDGFLIYISLNTDKNISF